MVNGKPPFDPSTCFRRRRRLWRDKQDLQQAQDSGKNNYHESPKQGKHPSSLKLPPSFENYGGQDGGQAKRSIGRWSPSGDTQISQIFNSLSHRPTQTYTDVKDCVIII
jgi:hypothetical protein